MTEILLSLALFAGDFHDLAAPHWRDRETATRRLADAGLPALPGAEWLRDTSPSAEVRARCARVAGEILDVGPMPWLCDPDRENVWDCLGGPLGEYLRRAREACAVSCYPEWPADRYAARLWAEDQLRAGVSVDEVRCLLDAMRCHEAEYKRRTRRVD